ncbi:MAG TPA: DUF6412 domain-containing protein [Amycolatopsis sp.]|uniref:DUF6412 domain-containing protein n=1 Tax=Amycolatopsis sp. TaxID=37632 RepID=UPI002B45A003|nr:DUF6412 domain-containing protein [Amycolatopsis sp.]HKS49520.1 DUF6412 domain-containing protein [Amycolatopsis sp.]
MGLWTVVLALNTVPGDLFMNPAAMLAIASVLAAGLVVVVAVQRIDIATAPVRVKGVALRERSRHTAFLRLRDPGAPGRSRPRAPGRTNTD